MTEGERVTRKWLSDGEIERRVDAICDEAARRRDAHATDVPKLTRTETLLLESERAARAEGLDVSAIWDQLYTKGCSKIVDAEDVVTDLGRAALDKAIAEGVLGGGVDFLDRLRALDVERVPMFGHQLNDWNALEWAGSLCGEAGELANVAKKLRRLAQGCNVNTGGATREQLVEQLAEEGADVAIYLDLLLASEGIDFREAIAKKFNAVSERVGFTKRLETSSRCNEAELRELLREAVRVAELGGSIGDQDAYMDWQSALEHLQHRAAALGVRVGEGQEGA